MNNKPNSMNKLNYRKRNKEKKTKSWEKLILLRLFRTLFQVYGRAITQIATVW